MSSKPFRNFSQEECIEFYNSLIKNAYNQWNIATTLSDAKQYGPATSHLLISIEETIKSIFVFLDTQGYQFRKVEAIDTIFRNHRIRFFIAYFMFAVSVVGEDFIVFIKKIKENPNLISEYSKLIIGKDELPVKLKYYLFKKLILFKKEQELFKRADIIRQVGFYADYNESISSPQDMTEQAYKIIYERMNKIKKFSQAVIQAYTPSDEIMCELIDDQKKMFEENKFYDLIGQLLIKAKSTKDSPFELLNI